jgi:hypothetical protein
VLDYSVSNVCGVTLAVVLGDFLPIVSTATGQKILITMTVLDQERKGRLSTKPM